MYATNPFEESNPPPVPARPKDDDRTPLMSSAQKTSPMPSYLRKSQSYQAQESTPAGPPPVPARSAEATQDMLNRRAKELDERERQLNAREKNAKQLEENSGNAPEEVDPRAPNWPPFLPKKWVYQNFELDIPAEVRPRVKMTYYHMFAIAILTLYNMLCGLAALFSYGGGALGDMIISCVLVVVVNCLVFFVYRRLYKACRVGSSLAYGIFLGGMIVEIIIDVLGALGWSGSGFIGIKWCCDLFKEECKVVGAMAVINGILWICSGLFDVFLFITIRNSFKKAGGMKAFKDQAASRATKGAVDFIKKHPDEAKKAGKAAVDYAKENPEVVKAAASTAVSAASEGSSIL